MEYLLLILGFLFLLILTGFVIILGRYWNDCLRKKTFRVEYKVHSFNTGSGESSEAHTWKDVVAETPEEAIAEARTELIIQTEREKIDLGETVRSYSDFQATKL